MSTCRARRGARTCDEVTTTMTDDISADQDRTLTRDVDVLVVGSGFGGSVAALRLTEKGYRVAVLEAGRRFADEDFAATSWHLRDFLWAPRLGCLGIQRVHRLRDVLVLAGAGVGGGSLVYANTLYEPLDAFYTDPSWGYLTDWKAELAPYYDQARRMLGVVTYAGRTPAEVCGLQNRKGSITAGKDADIIAVPGNPLEDITSLQRILAVIVAGKLIGSTKGAAGRATADPSAAV